jgi:mRNA-degrading endonuclease RelE of RelBE toxin-antitoxin system
MPFRLEFTDEARAQLRALSLDSGLSKRLKAVRKALAQLENNPNHPGLNVHAWRGEACPHGGQLSEAYAENHTPGAYRIFFCYVPKERGVILIVAITPHP